jgi:hypothetical protein
MEESYNFVNEGLPDFVGENPMEWILTAERFFVEQQIYPSDRVQWAFMRLEGVAMLWFQSWCMENLDADWETFAIDLVRRFGKSNYGVGVEEQLIEEGERNIQALSEKKNEAEHTRVSVTMNHTPVSDTSSSPESPPSGSLVKALPKPKPPDPSDLSPNTPEPPDPPSLESNPLESQDSDRFTATLSRRDPPPKSPDLSDIMDEKEETRALKEIFRRQSMWRPPPEPPNSALLVKLSRRLFRTSPPSSESPNSDPYIRSSHHHCRSQPPVILQQPDRPDAGSRPLTANKNISVLYKTRDVHVDQAHLIDADEWKGLEKLRAKWEINDAVGTKWSIDKVVISIISMSQIQANFYLILKEVATWAGLELLGLVEFNDSS